MGKAPRYLMGTLLFLVMLGLVLVTQPMSVHASPLSAAHPNSTITYIVRSGDYLYVIASRFGTTVRAVARANNLANPDLIYPGQALTIPVRDAAALESTPSSTPTDVAAPLFATPSPSSVLAPDVAPSPSDVILGASNDSAAKPESSAVAMTAREAAMFDAINSQRAAAGLPSLGFAPELMPIARARSSDMAARQYFSHTTPEGRNVHDLLHAAGLRYDVANEILARNNYPDDQSVSVSIAAFMRSDDHRGHILSPLYQVAAVGEARTSDGVKYYTVILASAH